MGLSNKEIIEACSKISKPEAEKTTEKPSIPEVHKTIEKPSIPEEDKPKVRLTYSDKLGIRSNEGNLTTNYLTPPK